MYIKPDIHSWPHLPENPPNEIFLKRLSCFSIMTSCLHNYAEPSRSLISKISTVLFMVCVLPKDHMAPKLGVGWDFVITGSKPSNTIVPVTLGGS